MKHQTANSALERLNQYIESNGLRPSVVRNCVLEQACLLPQPFTAAQLNEACKKQRISTGTVYNALDIFVSAQILHGINRQRGKNATEYELVNANSSYMQYICAKCGRTVNFKDKAISRLIRERNYSNFDLQHFSLIVYGECKICRTRLNADKQ